MPSAFTALEFPECIISWKRAEYKKSFTPASGSEAKTVFEIAFLSDILYVRKFASGIPEAVCELNFWLCPAARCVLTAIISKLLRKVPHDTSLRL